MTAAGPSAAPAGSWSKVDRKTPSFQVVHIYLGIHQVVGIVLQSCYPLIFLNALCNELKKTKSGFN